MSNLEIYKQAFIDSLSIDQKLLNKDLKYNEVPGVGLYWTHDTYV